MLSKARIRPREPYRDLQARHVTFDYQGATAMDELEWSFINPRFGLSYRCSEVTTSYFSIGRTHREPTRNDLFGGLDDLGTDENGSPLLFDVPPEQVVDYELGLTTGNNWWLIQANVYYMDFEDEIVLNGQYGPNGLPLHSNVAQSYRSGIEVSGRLSFKSGVSLINSSSYASNHISEAGVDFEPVLSPELIVNQEILYQSKGFEISLSGRYQSGSWIDLANSTELPSFLVFDAAVTYRIGRWEMSIRGFNLTNQLYFTNGSMRFDGVPLYFVQAPFNVYATVRYQL